MPLEIIGAGYGRTGTLSLQHALTRLGYPCYHMFEVTDNKANKTHMRFWRRVANAPEATQHHWETVFANYRATVDFPGAAVWRELVAAYPKAKVILSLHPRGAAGWYESAYDTIYAPERMWQTKVLQYTIPLIQNMRDMARKLIWQRALKGTMEHRDRAIARYNAHIEEVRATVAADRLLVFSVDQGWEPLCAFLGVAAPSGAFPNVNDRKELKKRIGLMARVAHLIVAFGIILAAAIIYAAIRIAI